MIASRVLLTRLSTSPRGLLPSSFLPALLATFLSRDLRAFLARFGESDRDCLLPALHCSALSAPAALQRSAFSATHCAFDAFARGFPVFPSARFFSPTLLRCHLGLR